MVEIATFCAIYLLTSNRQYHTCCVTTNEFIPGETIMHAIFLLTSSFALFLIQSTYGMDKKPSRRSRITRKVAMKESPRKNTNVQQLGDKQQQQEKSHRIRPTFANKNKEPQPISQISTPDPIIAHHAPEKTVLRTNSEKQINTRDSLLDAICRRDLEDVQILLKNFENPNLQIGTKKNTPLHQAVLLKYEEIAHAFLTCPSINSLIKNQDGRAAYQLIINDDLQTYQHLHHELQLRATLDYIIHAMILTDHKIFIDKYCSDKVIEKKISALRERINANTLPSYATDNFMVHMIRARLKYDLHTIKTFCDLLAKSPNQQDEWGNTLLHYAAYLHNKDLVSHVIADPRVDSLIRNNDKKLAHQLISTKNPQGSELRLLLFARNSLDPIVEKEALAICLNDPEIIILKQDEPSVVDAITAIKSHFKKVEKAQKKDRKLPDSSHLPYYASDQFIFEMLQSNMEKLQIVGNPLPFI